MNRKGFTLIELLVVIAIIAILAAILFPVLAEAKARTRQSVCQSNMKNIGTALTLYRDDYRGAFPLVRNQPRGTYGTSNANIHVWALLKRYSQKLGSSAPDYSGKTDGKTIFQCPEMKGAYWAYLSYATNVPQSLADYNLGWGINAYWNGNTRRDSDFTHIARTLYAVDANYDFAAVMTPTANGVSTPYWNEKGFPGVAKDYYLDPRHNGGYVVLFCDGHTRWMKTPLPVDIGNVRPRVDYNKG